MQSTSTNDLPQEPVEYYVASPNVSRSQHDAGNSASHPASGDSLDRETRQESDSRAQSQQRENPQRPPDTRQQESDSGEYGQGRKQVQSHRPQELSEDDEFSDSDSDSSDSNGPFHRQRLEPLECITEETPSLMADTPSSHRSTAHGSSHHGSGSFGSVLGSNFAHSDESHGTLAHTGDNWSASGHPEVIDEAGREFDGSDGQSALDGTSLPGSPEIRPHFGTAEPLTYRPASPLVTQPNRLSSGSDFAAGKVGMEPTFSRDNTASASDTTEAARNSTCGGTQDDCMPSTAPEPLAAAEGALSAARPDAAEGTTVDDTQVLHSAPSNDREVLHPPPSDLLLSPSDNGAASIMPDKQLDDRPQLAPSLRAHTSSSADASQSTLPAADSDSCQEQPSSGGAGNSAANSAAEVTAAADVTSATALPEQSAGEAGTHPDTEHCDVPLVAPHVAEATIPTAAEFFGRQLQDLPPVPVSSVSALQDPIAAAADDSEGTPARPLAAPVPNVESRLLSPPAPGTDGRLVERRKRAERQAALDVQRQVGIPHTSDRTPPPPPLLLLSVLRILCYRNSSTARIAQQSSSQCKSPRLLCEWQAQLSVSADTCTPCGANLCLSICMYVSACNTWSSRALPVKGSHRVSCCQLVQTRCL